MLCVILAIMNVKLSYDRQLIVRDFITINETRLRIRYNHGYPYVSWPGKNGQVAVHRVVMELVLGRKLGSTEHVHHKDENKLNNDPSNLEVVSEHLHLSRHTTARNTRYDPSSFVCSACRLPDREHKAHGLCANCWVKRRRRLKAKDPCKFCGLERADKRGKGREGMCVECTIRHWTACIFCKRTRAQLPTGKKSPLNLQGLCRACIAKLDRKAIKEGCGSWSYYASSNDTLSLDGAEPHLNLTIAK